MNENESKSGSRSSSGAVRITSDGKIRIYISDFVKGFLRFWWICVGLSLIIGGFMFLSSYRSYRPKYTVTSTFTVSTQNSSANIGGVSVYSFYYDTNTATQLADTFPYLLNSDLMQDAICADLGISWVPASLKASSVPGSNLFTLTAVGSDPQQTFSVMESVINNYPNVARYVVGNTRFVMIKPPIVPTSPSNTNDYYREGGKGLAAGFILGLVWVVLYAVMRRTIRTKDDIKEQLRISCIGTLPMVSFKSSVPREERNILISNPRLSSGYLESLRLIQNTLIQKVDKDKNVIMVTSTAPGEGKTTVAVNLASLLAEYGHGTLLIDADTRHPSVSPLLDIDIEDAEAIYETDLYKVIRPQGLKVNVLIFKVDEDGRIKRVSSSQIERIINKARKEYEYLIVDTPPCGLVSDTLFASLAADYAIYVIMQDTVRISKILSSLEGLMSSDIDVLGSILNGVSSGIGSYGRYGYGYGRSGYGKYGYGKYGYGKYGYGKYGYGKYGYGYGYGYGDTASSDGGRKKK